MVDWVHVAVMVQEVLHFLADRDDRRVWDTTVGAAGHVFALLERARRAVCLGVDRDPRILPHAEERLRPFADRVQLLCGVSDRVAEEHPQLFAGGFDGFLMDCGVSSLQLDTPERGFSIQHDGPLDARMGRSGRTVQDLLVGSSVEELEGWLRDYGQEPRARMIARRLHDLCRRRPPRRTSELAAFIASILPPRKPGGLHPATRSFMALRIAANDELGVLERTLAALPGHLRPGGRAVVISFHSLEDRLCKVAFREAARSGAFRLLTKSPLRPSEEEVQRNPRARSARLRAMERVS